jgi:cytochrome c-type biogenesis protein CcmH/NrfG
MNWSVWGAPIAVLSVGIIVGLVLTLRSKGEARGDPAAEARAKKDSLVDQLRALRADRSKLSPAEFDSRWNRTLERAAQALRDAENMALNPPPTPDPEATPHPVNWGRRLVWLLVCIGFFVGLGVTLKTYSDERAEGGIMTGGSQVTGATITQQIADLEEQVQADPSNIDPLNQLAHIAIQRGDLSGAMRWMDSARALDPDHIEVRTHMAILQASIGMTKQAEQALNEVLEIEPEFSKALFWSGVISLRSGDRETAILKLEAALNNASTREERVMTTQALAEARKPPATVMLRGAIGLAEGVDNPSSGVLFIMVRPSERAAGPPIAAIRLDPRGLPGTFTITDRDMMMAGSWPETVWIDARLDTDGNPSTKEDTDLRSVSMGPFSAGTEDIRLELSSSAAPSTTTPRVSGTLTLTDGTSMPSTGAVFIIFRRTATPQGPPVAALRLPLSAIPGDYSAGDSDIMMGGPWPEDVWVQARIDADGNAMTRSDDDLNSPVVGPIKSGSSSINLAIGNGS